MFPDKGLLGWHTRVRRILAELALHQFFTFWQHNFSFFAGARSFFDRVTYLIDRCITKGKMCLSAKLEGEKKIRSLFSISRFFFFPPSIDDTSTMHQSIVWIEERCTVISTSKWAHGYIPTEDFCYTRNSLYLFAWCCTTVLCTSLAVRGKVIFQMGSCRSITVRPTGERDEKEECINDKIDFVGEDMSVRTGRKKIMGGDPWN